MNIKYYSLKIYDYGESSDPIYEINCRMNYKNFLDLKKEAVNFWQDRLNAEEECIEQEFSWHESKSKNNNEVGYYATFCNDDCCSSCITVEELFDFVDKSEKKLEME